MRMSGLAKDASVRAVDRRLVSNRFPRATRYHPDWVLGAVSGAANPLWLAEWLGEAMDFRPGMRVLDLGCGRALSSVFPRREFGVPIRRDWARRLKRVFGIEIEQCARCGGKLKVIATIEEPQLMERILAHRRERGEEEGSCSPLQPRAPPQPSLF